MATSDFGESPLSSALASSSEDYLQEDQRAPPGPPAPPQEQCCQILIGDQSIGHTFRIVAGSSITMVIFPSSKSHREGGQEKKWGSMIRVVWEAHLHRQRLLQKLVQMEAKILHPRVFRFFHTCLPSCFPFCRKSRMSPTALEPQYTYQDSNLLAFLMQWYI